MTNEESLKYTDPPQNLKFSEQFGTHGESEVSQKGSLRLSTSDGC